MIAASADWNFFSMGRNFANSICPDQEEREEAQNELKEAEKKYNDLKVVRNPDPCIQQLITPLSKSFFYRAFAE